MYVKTFSELIDRLEEVKTDVMANEVADKSKELMQENVQKVVYDAYQPTHYDKGKYKRGRLKESVEADIDLAGNLALYNSRMDSIGFGKDYGVIRDVVNVVEYGKNYLWGNGKLDEKIGARPFIETTKKQLEGGLFKEYLVSGLRDKGLHIK